MIYTFTNLFKKSRTWILWGHSKSKVILTHFSTPLWVYFKYPTPTPPLLLSPAPHKHLTRRKFIFGSFLSHFKFFLNLEPTELFLYGRVFRQNKYDDVNFDTWRKYEIRKAKLYAKVEIGQNTWKKKYSEIKRAFCYETRTLSWLIVGGGGGVVIAGVEWWNLSKSLNGGLF